MVEATHNGASALVDIRISEQALGCYDPPQMASVVEQTIQRGEAAVREIVREAAGHDGGKPAR